MKILHCLHNYFPARGGAEWLMKNVSEKLVERGHEVNVVAANGYSVEDFFLAGKGKKCIPPGRKIIEDVTVNRVPFSRKGAFFLNLGRAAANRIPCPGGNRLRMRAWGPRSRSYLRACRRLDADLIAASPLPTLNVYYAWKTAEEKKIPLVIIPCFHTEDKWTYHNPLYFQMMRDAAAVITLTDREKEYLREEGEIPESRIHSIGVGIDLLPVGDSTDIRKKYKITQRQAVLFLGQQGKHKGIISLLQAMKYVWRYLPDTALVIAGNPTAYTKEIEKKISRLDKESQKKVYLIKGFTEEEKTGFLKTGDLFISVSPFESFGIVFLEAWAAKKAVIGCSRGGSARLIEEFQDGFLVESENSLQFAGAILELLENPDIRKQMGEKGYNKVKKHCTWDNVMNKWEEVYVEAVQSG